MKLGTISMNLTMMHVRKRTKYVDLTFDDFEIHKPDNDFLTKELNTNLSDYDPITGYMIRRIFCKKVILKIQLPLRKQI